MLHERYSIYYQVMHAVEEYVYLFMVFMKIYQPDYYLGVDLLLFNRVNTPRKQGGLGEMHIPLLSDKTGKISRDYGVLKEGDGIAFR